jgi:outer membrane protein assembly factor BamB
MSVAAMRQIAVTAFVALAFTPVGWTANWPQWRGPNGDGVSAETDLPLKWDDKTNILWTCPLADGASTPAIWGDAIFVTAQEGKTLSLVKINKKSGEIVWTKKIAEAEVPRSGPPRAKEGDERRAQKFHPLQNMASPSPVTDGEAVVAHFGNGELAAYDFEGKQLWSHNLQKEHGAYTIWWGHANSPVLFKNLVINVCMQDSLSDLGGAKSPSYVIAHDKKTGEQKWKADRMTDAVAEHCDAYTTPIFHKVEDKVEMIVMGGEQIDAYDPATGDRLWKIPEITGNRVITGPMVAGDFLYATQGMRGPLLALNLANGKPTKDSIAWKATDETPDAPSPVVWKDLLFYISDKGTAHCLDAKTGEEKWKQRLQGDFKSSPLAADGRVYFLNLAGKCTVVAATAKFEKLAENQIDDETIASLAVSDGRIYLRGRKALYCIGAK